MPFRGFDDPEKRNQWIGYMDNEYTEGIWEHEIVFTTAPGTEWTWRRCFAVGGKTNFWGRSSARFGDIDFRAASRDGYDVDWPMTYEEIAPYYSRVERMIGVASTVQNRPSNPDGEYLPPMNFRCIDRILESGAHKVGIPYLPDRIAQLTVPHAGHPACHYCANCTEGCDVGAFFSTPWFFLPGAEKSGNLDLRTNALAKNILVDENGRAKGVAYIDRDTKQEIEVYGKAVVVAASCVESARIVLNSKSRHWPNGHRELERAGRTQSLRPPVRHDGARIFPQLLGQPSFPDNVSSSTVAWMPRWQNLDEPARGEIHPRLFGLSGRRLQRVSVVLRSDRRLRPRVQTRDQAALSDAGQLLYPSADAAQRYQFRRHRSGGEGRLRHSGGARSTSSGTRTRC